MPRYHLTEAQTAVLREIFDDWRKRHPGMPAGDSDPGDDIQTPDVLIALTPSDGIPGRSGDVLGTADCDMYLLDEDGVLESMQVDPVPVYNLNAAATAGNAYYQAQRLKSGQWIVMQEALSDASWEFGKLDDALHADGGGSIVSIWEDTSEAEGTGTGLTTWSDTGTNQQAFAPPLLTTGSIAAGTWVMIKLHSNGRWYIVNAECD